MKRDFNGEMSGGRRAWGGSPYPSGTPSLLEQQAESPVRPSANLFPALRGAFLHEMALFAFQ